VREGLTIYARALNAVRVTEAGSTAPLLHAQKH
jgi:hypothetical protein